MYKEINFNEFCDEFKNFDREEQFSFEGKKALFEYIENYEFETREAQKMDIVALCCEYTEYPTAKEAAENYGFITSEKEEAEAEAEALNFLEEKTFVIKFDGGIIIFNF